MADDAFTPACPVERLGRELARLNDARNEADEQSVRLKSPWSDVLRERVDAFWEEIVARQTLAAYSRATSVGGALVHLGLISLAVEELGELVPIEDRAAAERIASRIRRQLYSAAGVLTQALGPAAAGLGMEHHLPARGDIAATMAAAEEIGA